MLDFAVSQATPPQQRTTLTVVKRNGERVGFEADKIRIAVRKCLNAIGYIFGARDASDRVADTATQLVLEGHQDDASVDEIQNAVERALQMEGLFDAAKAYILYRARRDEERGPTVQVDVQRVFAEAAQYFPTPIQQFQFFDKYSRFSHELGRRETWIETVRRSVDFLRELAGGKLPESTLDEIRDAILKMEAMPSMRLLAMAGDPARRTNIAIYNCSFLAVDSTDAFVEALIISMAGCGVGFSVERVHTDQLPRVDRQQPHLGKHRLVVGDSAEGWAEALRTGLISWFTGGDVEFDYSSIRPAGTVLKTKGGRASGPEPLRRMLDFIKAKILSRQGSRLRPVDAHDIMTVIGDCVVQGGVRRTAMISLFDFDDRDMETCKFGEFWKTNPQRCNANNSAVWPEERLTQAEIARLLLEMDRSGTGEPGIFVRRNSRNGRPPRRADYAYFGTNPCGEIVLRSNQFCNLTIAVARAGDSLQDLERKVRVAAIVGTIQSTATHFPGLREKWAKNCEEERLLGVDVTGQMDRPLTVDEAEHLKAVAVRANAETADLLGINRSAAVTCVKPSGNSSVLLGCSPGINPRWSKFQIRNVRVATTSPVFKVLEECGVPMDPENGQSAETATTYVAHFPVKAPDGAKTRHDISAVDQCEYWLLNKRHWTEHNPSCTITYRPDELIPLMQWIFDHQDEIGGMAFLPASDAVYQQMPNVEITEDEYNRLTREFPTIDFSLLAKYEQEDATTAAQELACISGACHIL